MKKIIKNKKIIVSSIAIVLVVTMVFISNIIGVSADNEENNNGTTVTTETISSTAVTTSAPFSVPSGIKLTTGRASTTYAPYIKVTFNKTSGATSYRIAYKRSGKKYKWVAKNTTKNSYTIPTLTNSKKYWVCVKVNKNGSKKASQYSKAKSITTPKVYKFPVLKNFKVKVYTDGSADVRVSFSKIKGVKKYEIAFRQPGSPTWEHINTTSNSCKFGIGYNNRYYIIKVQALGFNKYTTSGNFTASKKIKTGKFKMTVDYCEHCGMPIGWGTDHCVQYCYDMECPGCDKKVKAFTCHHCANPNHAEL